MAKNVGLIRFLGTLDGLVSYRRNGEDVFQRPGGFKGERMRTEERYEGVRQLQGEFGRCSSIAALLKRSLQSYLSCIPDIYIYNWIQSGMTALKEFDVASARGEKTVGKGLATIAGRKFLEGFSFNRIRGLRSVLNAAFEVDLGEGRFLIRDFRSEMVRFPKGCAVGGLQFLVMRVDFEGRSGLIHEPGRKGEG